MIGKISNEILEYIENGPFDDNMKRFLLNAAIIEYDKVENTKIRYVDDYKLLIDQILEG